MFLIHVSVRPNISVRVDEIVFPLLLYGKTFWLVSFFLYYPNNKFFSIYNYLFRFYFSLFGFQWTFLEDLILMVGPSGLEPPTSCLSGTRSNLLSYEPMWLVWCFHTWVFWGFTSWWRWWDSNPWPPACRAGALPAELHPRINSVVVWRISSLLFLRSRRKLKLPSYQRCRHWAIFPYSLP